VWDTEERKEGDKDAEGRNRRKSVRDYGMK
jgi:hypothetical protein